MPKKILKSNIKLNIPIKSSKVRNKNFSKKTAFEGDFF